MSVARAPLRADAPVFTPGADVAFLAPGAPAAPRAILAPPRPNTPDPEFDPDEVLMDMIGRPTRRPNGRRVYWTEEGVVFAPPFEPAGPVPRRPGEMRDEIREYMRGRYLPAREAMGRLLGPNAEQP